MDYDNHEHRNDHRYLRSVTIPYRFTTIGQLIEDFRHEIEPMKVKRLNVGVRSLDEGLRALGSTLKALQSGRPVTKRTGVYFINVDAMRQVLTPSRLTLMHLIRTRRPGSIASLAKRLGRNFKNVHIDVTLLADLRLVHVEPGAHLRNSVTPTVPYERSQFKIAV